LRARFSPARPAAGDEEHFPSTIDPRIYHVKLIRNHLGDLSGKRCSTRLRQGPIRARVEGAGARLRDLGLDISEEMLRFVPQAYTRAPAP